MRIFEESTNTLLQNNLTMVNENSASSPYSDEVVINNFGNGRNIGNIDFAPGNEDDGNNLINSNYINHIATSTKQAVQLNLFGEVSVDQGEKKWVKGYTKKDGTIVKGYMKYKNNIKASKKKTKKIKKSQQKNNGSNSLMTSFFNKV